MNLNALTVPMSFFPFCFLIAMQTYSTQFLKPNLRGTPTYMKPLYMHKTILSGCIRFSKIEGVLVPTLSCWRAFQNQQMLLEEPFALGLSITQGGLPNTKRLNVPSKDHEDATRSCEIVHCIATLHAQHNAVTWSNWRWINKAENNATSAMLFPSFQKSFA